MKNRKSRLLRIPYPRKAPSPNKPKLQAGRDKTTAQVAIMSEHDRAAHGAFVQAFVSDYRPRNTFERQLVRRLADYNWRLNRLEALEENIFAWAQSGPYVDIRADHPQIQHAMVQTQTFIDDPQLFGLLSLYERRLTQNLEANLKMLLKLQSLPMPNREQNEPIAEAVQTAEVPEIARAASGELVLQEAEKAA
ncbi:MAG TPA: hypothetical protein VKB79_16380 [Bryobacteraceae bacterium]|nr:hypothetical protein [Bryobacteraceae bacterium]